MSSGSPVGGALEESERTLVRLSEAMASRDEAAIDLELRRAAGNTPPERVDETVLQACLFLGFPTTLETAMKWAAIRGAPAGEGETPESAGDEVLARGEDLCRRVYGSAYDSLRGNVAAAHPALDRWMVLDGYGRVLSRPGLEAWIRELCIVAMLASRDWERQLHSHLRGALRLGAEPAQVAEALSIGVSRQTAETKRRLIELWEGIRERHEGREPVEDRDSVDVH